MRASKVNRILQQTGDLNTWFGNSLADLKREQAAHNATLTDCYCEGCAIASGVKTRNVVVSAYWPTLVWPRPIKP